MRTGKPKEVLPDMVITTKEESGFNPNLFGVMPKASSKHKKVKPISEESGFNPNLFGVMPKTSSKSKTSTKCKQTEPSDPFARIGKPLDISFEDDDEDEDDNNYDPFKRVGGSLKIEIEEESDEDFIVPSFESSRGVIRVSGNNNSSDRFPGFEIQGLPVTAFRGKSPQRKAPNKSVGRLLSFSAIVSTLAIAILSNSNGYKPVSAQGIVQKNIGNSCTVVVEQEVPDPIAPGETYKIAKPVTLYPNMGVHCPVGEYVQMTYVRDSLLSIAVVDNQVDTVAAE